LSRVLADAKVHSCAARVAERIAAEPVAPTDLADIILRRLA
jgi:hypothetical protein